MPHSAIAKSLVVYSNPAPLDRLRLDKEHKAVEEVLRTHRLPDYIIKRIHAATLYDVGTALREQDYELVLFSGHGGKDGLYLENGRRDPVTSWDLLSKTLKNSVPNLCVVIINACYSTSAESALHEAAPFLILMNGAANDEAAIAFSRHFLDEYYRSGGVEQAFKHATWALGSLRFDEDIEPVLTRRQAPGQSVVQACFDRRQDSIFINLADAEPSISRLPVSRHEFLALLTRKLRVHSWIFRVERERAVIPIGHFFGVFSWSNAKDVVTCHEVLQLRKDIALEDCMGWTRAMVFYNDLRSNRYRVMDNPAAAENKALLFEVLKSVRECDRLVLCADDVALAARRLVSEKYVIILSNVRTQCDLAEKALGEDDLVGVVGALETAISSIHDLVNALTAAVTIPRTEA
jgi:hypothetical protein